MRVWYNSYSSSAIACFFNEDCSWLHLTPRYNNLPKVPFDDIRWSTTSVEVVYEYDNTTYPFTILGDSSTKTNDVITTDPKYQSDTALVNDIKSNLSKVTSDYPILFSSSKQYFTIDDVLLNLVSSSTVDLSTLSIWCIPRRTMIENIGISSYYNTYPSLYDLLYWVSYKNTTGTYLRPEKLPELHIVTNPYEVYRLEFNDNLTKIGDINSVFSRVHISTGTLIIDEKNTNIKADDVDLSNFKFNHLLVNRNSSNYFVPFSTIIDENEHQDLPMDVRMKGYVDCSSTSRTFDSYVGVNNPDFTKEGYYVGQYPACAQESFKNTTYIKSLTGFNDWDLTNYGRVLSFNMNTGNSDNYNSITMFYKCDNIDGFNRWKVRTRDLTDWWYSTGEQRPGFCGILTRGTYEDLKTESKVYTTESINFLNDWEFIGDDNAEGTPVSRSAPGFSFSKLIGCNIVNDFQGLNNWIFRKGSSVCLGPLFQRLRGNIDLPDQLPYAQGRSYHDYTNIFQNWEFEDSVYLYFIYTFTNMGLKDTEFFRTWKPFTPTMRIVFERLFLLNRFDGYPIDLSGLGSLKFPEGITLDFSNMFSQDYSSDKYPFTNSSDAQWDFSQLDPWGDQPGFDPESDGAKYMFGSQGSMSSNIKKPSWWVPANGGWSS